MSLENELGIVYKTKSMKLEAQEMQKRLLLSQGRFLDGPTSVFREGGPNEQPTMFLSATIETYKADSCGAFGFNQNNQRTAIKV